MAGRVITCQIRLELGWTTSWVSICWRRVGARASVQLVQGREELHGEAVMGGLVGLPPNNKSGQAGPNTQLWLLLLLQEGSFQRNTLESDRLIVKKGAKDDSGKLRDGHHMLNLTDN